MNSGTAKLLVALPWRLYAAHLFRRPRLAGAMLSEYRKLVYADDR